MFAVAVWFAFVWAGPSFEPHDASFRKYALGGGQGRRVGGVHG